MSNHTANTVRTALVLAIAVFVIAFALLLFVGEFGFFASFFLALLVALLAGIVLFIGFGTSGAAAPSVQRTATSGSGAAASAPGGGETATDGQADGDDASRQAAAEAEAAEKEAAEKKAADERRAAEAAEAERRDAEKAAEAERARAAKEAEEAERARAAEKSAEAERARAAEEAAAAERRRAEEEAERKRAEEAAAVAADAVPSGEDYDGDGVVEGTDEGTRPAGLDAPRDGKADDLKQIKGIGAKMEALCNRLGFWHFDQIASWTADEVAWVDANLEGFKGRVTRDDWVGQAKILAEGGATEFSKRVEDGDVY